MNQYVYIIVGTTGEFSNREEWYVNAYLNEDTAKERIIELEHLMRVYGYNPTLPIDYKMHEKLIENMQKDPNGDNNFRIESIETNYYYLIVELKTREHLMLTQTEENEFTLPINETCWIQTGTYVIYIAHHKTEMTYEIYEVGSEMDPPLYANSIEFPED